MMRIAVVGTCQAHGYANAFAHLLPEADVQAFEVAIVRQHDHIELVADALRRYDVIFTQHVGPEFGALATEALPQLGRPVHGLPMVVFAGYQPDHCYMVAGGQIQPSPTNPLHSALLAAAWSLGVPAADIPPLFNRLVYAELGYFDAFATQRTLLLDNLAGFGLDMTAAFDRWHARGPFMHTALHPRGFVFADIATAIAIRVGLVGADAVAVEPVCDDLALDIIWPVYPELAAPLGVAGSLLFKRRHGPILPLGHAVYMPLAVMVRDCCALYPTLPPEGFAEGSIGATREKLRPLLGL